jgi:hypothetical protein
MNEEAIVGMLSKVPMPMRVATCNRIVALAKKCLETTYEIGVDSPTRSVVKKVDGGFDAQR